jgi:tetratricopeptide (TPR) repeat protein
MTLSSCADWSQRFDALAARVAHADGVLRLRTGGYERARNSLLHALASAAAAGGDARVAAVHDSLGTVHARLGDELRALHHYQASLAAKERTGDALGQAITHGNLGRLYLGHGRAEDALVSFERNLELARAAQDRFGEVMARSGRGHALLELRRLDEAEQSFRDAVQVAQSADLVRQAALCTKDLALVAERRGDGDEAIRRADEAGTAFAALEILEGAGFCALIRGRVHFRRDELPLARAHLAHAVTTLRETHRHDLLAEALITLAEASAAADDPDAETWLDEAAALAREHVLRGVLQQVESARERVRGHSPDRQIVVSRNVLGFGAGGRQYLLMDQLDAGGQGAAWRALDLQSARLVVVKQVRLRVAPHEREVVLQMLLREYAAAMRIDHPGVVRVHGFERVDETFHLAMDLLPGPTLHAALQKTSRPRRDQAWAWIGDIARAIDAMHAAGVIHRDLKPANIMLNEGGRPVLIDFGLALLDVAPEGDDALPSGTYGYMSPEQLLGRSLGPPADLFALGVIAAELLTGANFLRIAPNVQTFTDFVATMTDHSKFQQALGRIRWPDELPAGERTAVLRLLSFDAADRFATAEEFLSASGH